MNLTQALLMAFDMEPGATAARASEMIDGNPPPAEISALCAEMVAAGQLEVFGDGWRVVTFDPTEVARSSLQEIEAMPGPAAAVAKKALDKIGRRNVGGQ